MKRVVVTGRGAVTCFGAGCAALVDAVFVGRSGILPRRRLAGLVTRAEVAAEVPEEVAATAREHDSLAFGFALRAAREALAAAQVDAGATLGLVLATTKADLGGVEGAGEGYGRPWVLAARLAEELVLHGPVTAVSCACASGLVALAHAGRWLRAGRAERVLVVGVDALSGFVVQGFERLLALSTDPCRPFDRRRTGLSLGEGAGALVLEARAERDGCVELAGWGAANDANHITGPCRDGSGLALAIERALAHARLLPAAIDLVHLHGTGTVYNDAMECRALERIFATPPPLAGSKAQLGHTLGAAGLLESLIAIEALERGLAPPNVRLARPEADFPAALVRGTTPLGRARHALKIAAGFGGIDAALVFAR